MTDSAKPGTFRSALGRRDLRWYLLHHALAGTAQSLGTVAVSVALFDQTDSTRWVAAVAVARLLPYLLLSSIAGVFADRLPVRPVLGWSAAGRALVLVVSAVAVAAEAPPMLVVGLVALGTTIGTPCYPALAAVVPTVVPVEDLAPANGLLNTIETTSWTIGPAVGGLLLLVGEPSLALIVNAALFALSGLVLVGVRTSRTRVRPAAGAKANDEPFWSAFTTGVRTAIGSAEIAVPLLLVVVVNIIFGGAAVGLIVVADELLHSGRSGFGLLNAALGVGGFLGMAVTNRVAAMRRPDIGIMAATLVAGAPFALLALVQISWVAWVLMILAGTGSVVAEVVAMTVLLRALPQHLIARIFGLTDSLLVGSILFGSIVAPGLIHAIGIEWSLVVVGAALPATAVVAARQLQRLGARGVRKRVALAPRLELLAAQPWLRYAPPLALESLAATAVEEVVRPGGVVIREGDDADDFFLVLEGDLDVSKLDSDGQIVLVNHVGPGEGFGEIGLLGSVPRTATVAARGPVRLLRLGGDAFVDVVNAAPSSADSSVGAGQVARAASGAVLEEHT